MCKKCQKGDFLAKKFANQEFFCSSRTKRKFFLGAASQESA
jgi:hypothetical protein